MPSGYTEIVAKGCTFEEFVWRCARAFGATILMRDEPLDATIPEKFEPSDFYAKREKEARQELERLRKLTPAQADAEAEADYRQAREAWLTSKAAATELRQRFHVLLSQVNTWEPPDPEHAGLKKFMQEQLSESMDFDCHVLEEPYRPTSEAWLEQRLKEVERDLDRATSSHADELRRTEERNAWLAVLRGSVPQPEPKRDCLPCSGTGKHGKNPCPMCDGTGRKQNRP